MYKDFIEQCLYFTALYLGKDSGGTAELNTQFRWMQTLDAEVLLRGVQFRVLPGQLVFEELQRRAIVSDQYDYADVQRMFDEEMENQQFTQSSMGNVINQQASTSATVGRTSMTTTPFGFKRGSGRAGQ